MAEEPKKSWLREIIDPFIELAHAPRALWGVNVAYTLEGLSYFGVLTYLAMYFSDYVFQSVEHSDVWAHEMVMVLTAGIAISMVVLGFVPDKWGVRRALVLAFVLLLAGRFIIAGAPNVLGLAPIRPGVMVGDQVTLRVKGVGTLNGNKAVTASDLLASVAGSAESISAFAVNLSTGPGVTPDAALESHLVRVTSATAVKGDPDDKNEWEIRYGAGGTLATLYLNSQDATGLCEGATFDLNSAYVSARAAQTGSEGSKYLIRSSWHDDFANVNRTACDKPPPTEAADVEGELALKATKRWQPEDQSTTDLEPITVADLRRQADGNVDRVLPSATVTYVRNGGYFLQQDRDGPAIFVFVDPVWSPLHLITMLGLILVLIGYGMYQPGAYSAVRQFTTPKTASMAYAMLYALMNAGSSLLIFAFVLRDKKFLGLGIPGTFWVFTAITVVSLFTTYFVLSKKTVEKAIADAKAATAADEAAKAAVTKKPETATAAATDAPVKVPITAWVVLGAILLAVVIKVPDPWKYVVAAVLIVGPLSLAFAPDRVRKPVIRWIAEHPLGDSKFFFFIFALMPVQTLFTYNWLILPQYIQRSYAGWMGEFFEIFSNMNPVMIFIAVPAITALTYRVKIYNIMIWGTLVMGASAFVLAFGSNIYTLTTYLILMTIGEAMWSARFLQYATEIAPEGRAGLYQGVAQLPWFLTKFLVPLLYSGQAMERFCPAQGPKDTEQMWLIFGLIAITTPIMLILAKRWVGKDFRTKAA
jgi:proton-dependent oligopeptide transporter, POT family